MTLTIRRHPANATQAGADFFPDVTPADRASRRLRAAPIRPRRWPALLP